MPERCSLLKFSMKLEQSIDLIEKKTCALWFTVNFMRVSQCYKIKFMHAFVAYSKLNLDGKEFYRVYMWTAAQQPTSRRPKSLQHKIKILGANCFGATGYVVS